MLVASNRAPIWRHEQSSGPFCAGTDADVQTARAETPAMHRKWTGLTVSLCTFAVIPQKVGQAAEILSNQSARIPHPELTSAHWLAVERSASYGAVTDTVASEQSRRQPDALRALTFWSSVNQHMIENEGVTDHGWASIWEWSRNFKHGLKSC